MRKDQIYVAGIDEVGRGSLFGPVFAGAVVLNTLQAKNLLKNGLKDSKKLTAKKRFLLVPIIKRNCRSWAIGQASAKEIDRLGIRFATEKAMIRALEKLPRKPDLVLVDGILKIKQWEGDQKTIINGDNKFASIAAASVLAKEARDKLIQRLAIRFPNYELEKNVGYGTKIHRQRLRDIGATNLHRISFLSKIL